MEEATNELINMLLEFELNKEGEEELLEHSRTDMDLVESEGTVTDSFNCTTQTESDNRVSKIQGKAKWLFRCTKTDC